MEANKKHKKITAQQAAATPSLLGDRLNECTAQYKGVTFHLSALNWPQKVYSETMGAQRAEGEEYDFMVQPMLYLQFGVTEIGGVDGLPEKVTIKTTRKGYEVYPQSVFEDLPADLVDQLYVKVHQLTHLSDDEEIKLVFTSPLPESTSEPALAAESAADA